MVACIPLSGILFVRNLYRRDSWRFDIPNDKLHEYGKLRRPFRANSNQMWFVGGRNERKLRGVVSDFSCRRIIPSLTVDGRAISVTKFRMLVRARRRRSIADVGGRRDFD